MRGYTYPHLTTCTPHSGVYSVYIPANTNNMYEEDKPDVYQDERGLENDQRESETEKEWDTQEETQNAYYDEQEKVTDY